MDAGVVADLADPSAAPALFRALHAEGFTSCQLHLGGCRLGAGPLAAIGAAAREAGIRIAAASGYANPLRPAEGPRGFTEGTLFLLARLLPHLGTRQLVTWSGTRSPDPGAGHPENGGEGAWAELLAHAGDLLGVAASSGVEVLFEPHHAHVLGSPEAALRFLDATGSASASLALDPADLVPPGFTGDRDAEAGRIASLLAPRSSLIHVRDPARCRWPARAGRLPPAILRNVPTEDRAAARRRLEAALGEA